MVGLRHRINCEVLLIQPFDDAFVHLLIRLVVLEADERLQLEHFFSCWHEPFQPQLGHVLPCDYDLQLPERLHSNVYEYHFVCYHFVCYHFVQSPFVSLLHKLTIAL